MRPAADPRPGRRALGGLAAFVVALAVGGCATPALAALEGPSGVVAKLHPTSAAGHQSDAR